MLGAFHVFSLLARRASFFHAARPARPSLSLLLALNLPALAVDGTWKGPGSDLNNPGNWTSSPQVPNGNGTFAGANPGIITFSDPVTIQTLTFAAGAGTTYAFNLSNAASQLTLTGLGIVNNTTGQQAFSLTHSAARLNFQNSATAADASIAASNFSVVTLQNSSSAGTATITAASATVNFLNTSTAGSAKITNTAGAVNFSGTATAGSATITTTGTNAGFFDTVFSGSATASTATINAGSAGRVVFTGTSSLGTATFNNTGVVSTTNFLGAYLLLATTTPITTPTINNNLAGITYVSTGTNLGSAKVTNNNGGILNFISTGSAGSATIVNNNGGITSFSMPAVNGGLLFGNKVGTGNVATATDTPTSASATITNNDGGQTFFFNKATGGATTIVNNTGGTLDISGITATDFTLASLTGGGTVRIGSKALTITGGGSMLVDGAITEGGVGGGTGGSLIYAGNGTLILAGTNLFAGSTTVNSGATLQIGNGGASGQVASIINNGNVIYNRSDDLTITTSITGTGTLTKIGSNTITLTGDNSSYAGSSVVTAGGAILAGKLGGSLTINGGTATIASGGVLGGAATVNGTMTVNGTVGGAATVNSGGILTVNGRVNGATTVNTGGLLKGSGTVGSFAGVSGGIVAPGNSIGTLNVAGNASFASGSIYQVEVNAAGQADLINATGSATISGGTVQVITPASLSATDFETPVTYTIVNAIGGVSGTFTSVTTDQITLLSAITYTPTQVQLTVRKAFPDVTGTPNQIASGNAIKTGSFGGGALYSAFLGSSSAAARPGFDAASGEIHATLLAGQFENAMATRRAVLNRMRGKPDSEAGWSLWGNVTGGWGSIDGDGNAAGATRSGVDITAGADTHLDENWRGGFEGGFSSNQLGVAARNSGASLTSGHIGAYASGRYEAAVLRVGGSYGFGAAKTIRAIAFSRFNDTASASQDTNTEQLFGELGYEIPLDTVTLEPFAGIAWTHLNAGAFRETGGSAALAGTSRDMDDAFSTLGFAASVPSFDLGGAALTPSLRAGWQHAFTNSLASRSLSFVSTTQAFTVLGTPLDADRAVIDLGATLALSGNAEVTLGYSGTLGTHASDHAVHLMAMLKL